MNQQTWELTSQISGNFLLISEEHLRIEKPPIQSIQKVVLSPHSSEQGHQTGVFDLKIELTIKTEPDEKPSGNDIADVGRNAFEYYIEILTFLSLSPIQVIKAPTLIHNLPGTRKFRQISFPSQQVTISRPLPITSKSFLSINMNSDIRRVVAWLRIGLQERDLITSFLALFTCIEILSHKFENNDLRISRICPTADSKRK